MNKIERKETKLNCASCGTGTNADLLHFADIASDGTNLRRILDAKHLGRPNGQLICHSCADQITSSADELFTFNPDDYSPSHIDAVFFLLLLKVAPLIT